MIFMKMIKADLHNHLQTCKPTCSFNDVIDIASERLGEGGTIGIVNVTDPIGLIDNDNPMIMNGDDRYEKFLASRQYDISNIGNAFYVPEKKVLVIKGDEIINPMGHLLILGVEEGKHIKNYKNVEDTLKQAKDFGGVVIADHPFFVQGIGPHLEKHLELVSDIDALEVHNGEAFYGNKKAQEFYDFIKKDFPHLGAVAFSDGHSLREIGSSYTELPCLDIRNSESLKQSLRYAVRNPFSCKKHASYYSAFNHTIDMAVVIGLRKLGVAEIISSVRIGQRITIKQKKV